MSEIRFKGAELLEDDEHGRDFAMEVEFTHPLEGRLRKVVVHADALHRLLCDLAGEYEDEDGDACLELRMEDLDEAEADDNGGAGIPLDAPPLKIIDAEIENKNTEE